MRLVKDTEGDIWEETQPGKFTCRTGEFSLEDWPVKRIESRYGVEAIYAPVEVDE